MRAYQRARLLRARAVPRRPWVGVRIFGYHSISDRRSTLCVHPDAFREQMEQLAASDVEVVPLMRALDLCATGTTGRYACVTFDDGYRDNAEVAEPILRDLGIPATIFAASEIVAGHAPFYWFDDPPPAALGWDELRALLRAGLIDVQAHTRTHPWLTRVDDDRAREEIAGCKRDLEEALGVPVTSFCYPAGLYGDRDVGLVAQAGYRAALTTEPGVNGAATPILRLRRTLVYRDDGHEGFAAKLAGALDSSPLGRRWIYARRAGG